MNRRFRLKIAAMSLPALAGFLVFYIVPFFRSIGYSFTKSAVNRDFVGFENYRAVLSNEYFRLALKNTLIFSAAGVAAIMLLSLLLSLELSKLSKKIAFLKSFFVMPYVLPSASIIFFWQMFFGTESYAALTEIEGLGGFFDVMPLYIIFLWKNVGINIILLTSALSKIPREVYEAAALDGARGLRLHTKITLPLLSPSLFFVGVLSFVNSLKIFKESYLYYNSNYPPDSAYMVQNYMNNHFYKLNYQNLSTAVVIFTLATAAVIFVWYKLENKLSEGTF